MNLLTKDASSLDESLASLIAPLCSCPTFGNGRDIETLSKKIYSVVANRVAGIDSVSVSVLSDDVVTAVASMTADRLVNPSLPNLPDRPLPADLLFQTQLQNSFQPITTTMITEPTETCTASTQVKAAVDDGELGFPNSVNGRADQAPSPNPFCN